MEESVPVVDAGVLVVLLGTIVKQVGEIYEGGLTQ